MKRLLVGVVLAGAALLLVIQFVPYGREHSNPPVLRAAQFADPRVRQIVADSCDDCHSNLTKWPWYTNIAPVSWLVQNDVEGGRRHMNLSQWDSPQPELDEVIDAIESGSMPPRKYRLMPNHAAARLSGAQKRKLADAFRRLYATQPPPVGRGED